ncbi:MAG: NUDIX hydrolase [Owenweeksia sp.]|nr:NUDIX hydrolase [Owenweeksia sp.]
MNSKKIGSWIEQSQREIYDNPWIRVTESQVLNPNGGEGIYGVVHFKNYALGVIALDEENNTWIVGQERFPFNGKYTWEIVEGGGPVHLDPLLSAQRELLEEAGLKAIDWELIQEMDLSNSATDERALIYVARGLTYHQNNPDETEKLEVRKIPFEELYKMVIRGEIVDSLSVAGVLKLKADDESMKSFFLIVLASLIFTLSFSSCEEERICPVDRQVVLRAGLYELVDSSDQDTILSGVSIKGLGVKDSLYSDSSGVSQLLLPPSPYADSAAFSIHLNGKTDTLWLLYTSEVLLFSEGMWLSS